eukprot:846827-Pyramimonas_sp.AAC.1
MSMVVSVRPPVGARASRSVLLHVVALPVSCSAGCWQLCLRSSRLFAGRAVDFLAGGVASLPAWCSRPEAASAVGRAN